MTPIARRRALAALVSLLCAAGAVTAAPADAAVTRPARGVTVWQERFVSVEHHREHAYLIRVDLTVRGTRLDTYSPRDVVGAERADTRVLAAASGAVAGINGDWFDMASWSAVPRGALVRNGRLLKSPRTRKANFYVRPDGRAAIGPLTFHGLVTRPASGSRPATAVRIWSVNTPDDARNDHITFVTSRLVVVPWACTAALGVTRLGRHVVTGIVNTWSMPRLTSSTWALVSCGGSARTWLRTRLRPGDQLSLSLGLAQGRPSVAISGGRVLVSRGRAYDDVHGQHLYGLNPMTFVCVSRTGRTVLLGGIDGRTRASIGVDYRELTAYLVHKRCWSAMTLDGGGSTTVVAHRPGVRGVSVLNQPSDGRPRPVADGLFVYARH